MGMFFMLTYGNQNQTWNIFPLSSESALLVLWKIPKNFHFCIRRLIRGVTRGGNGAQFPGRRMTARVAKKSQQCRKYFLQYSTFASERPQVRTWERQTCFLPRAPSNLVTLLRLIAWERLIEFVDLCWLGTLFSSVYLQCYSLGKQNLTFIYWQTFSRSVLPHVSNA